MPEGNRQKSAGAFGNYDPRDEKYHFSMDGTVREYSDQGILVGEDGPHPSNRLFENGREIERGGVISEDGRARGIDDIRENNGVRSTEQLDGVDYKRQISIFDPEQFENTTITIAGLGNIGSHSALAIARMGLKHFQIWDFDKVEAHNLSSQAYDLDDMSGNKIAACSRKMHLINPVVHVDIHGEPFTGDKMVGQILISAVDSMEIRREIASKLPDDVFVIDGRMGGGQIEVWSQLSQDWGKTLTKDGDTDPCGARYISYTSYIIAGLIANQVKRHLLKERIAKKILFHTNTLEIIREF